ncbi:MAG: GAF domain-containing protein [Bacteroidales bacterium]|nr:GAF domain-containing protein [Bacteroidales bacterium]
MAFKKKSIISGIKIFLSIIFVLSILNYFLTNYFNKKIIDKENKVILINKSLFLTEQILNQFNSSENADFDKITSSLSDVKSFISILTEGGKFNVLIIKNKISPVEKVFSQTFSDIKKRIKKNNEILQKHSDADLLYFEKYKKELVSNLSFIIHNLNNTENSYKKSIQSLSVRKNITDILTLLLILVSAILIYLKIKKDLSENIENLQLNLQSLTNTSDISKFQNSEEFAPVISGIESFNIKFKEISDFINNLLSDNYSVNFKTEEQKDPVQKSLTDLRNKLKENIEINDKRLEDERRRQWFAEGQAKFNDILREASSGIENLAETALINMVKFLNAAQGGFFIVNDNETAPFLELTSAFAYDRIKMLTKRIEFGDGLVGMCAVEKNTVVITDVPDDYMQIESVLGEATPNNILIFPLKTEDNILGVVEIASFYEFKKTEIEFIENIAEDIAKTLETTKITDKTAELLEETQKKSQELAMRDTEMSEKINELKDAQKETKRSESEINALISVIDKILFKIELTTAGKINSINNLFLNRLGYRLTEMRNKTFSEFIKDKNKQITEDVFNEISKNSFTHKEIIFTTKDNNEIKTNSLFSAVRNEKGEIIRILMLADNTSFREELQKKNELLKEELNAKIRIISEKEKEINSVFNKIKKNELITDDKILLLKQREDKILQSFETPAEKKYAEWLKDIKF